jgi:16S rRNA (cytosine967-C5)-methyltransferase
MKLHRNIALGIELGLKNTLVEKKPAADVIKRLLKSNTRWGSRDRKAIGKIFYDIIRKKRLIEESLGFKNNETNNNLLQLIGGWMALNGHTLPNWEEFIKIEIQDVVRKADYLIKERKYKYSIPDWLDEMGVEAFGEVMWGKEIEELNRPAKLIIRVNRIKITSEKLKEILDKNYGIKTAKILHYKDALIIDKHLSLKDIKEYKQGFFEVQDANSQAISPWLKPKSGKYYIDACAGAGGKSLHIADLTRDKSKIMALDIYGSKLEELQKRVIRNKVESIKTKCVMNPEVIKSINANADGLLIDAPCSGIGVLKRNPDTKWLMNPDRIKRILTTQENILQTYSSLVKKGGELVYATCSILPVENRDQIDNFLNSEKGLAFEFDQDKTYLSHQTGFDGFYCARLIRKM